MASLIYPGGDRKEQRILGSRHRKRPRLEAKVGGTGQAENLGYIE